MNRQQWPNFDPDRNLELDEIAGILQGSGKDRFKETEQIDGITYGVVRGSQGQKISVEVSDEKRDPYDLQPGWLVSPVDGEMTDLTPGQTASDIGRAIYRGVGSAAYNINLTATQLLDGVAAATAKLFGREAPGATFEQGLQDLLAWTADTFAPDGLHEWETSVMGEPGGPRPGQEGGPEPYNTELLAPMVEMATQFAAGAFPAARVVKALGVANPIVRGFAWGGIADFSAMPEDEQTAVAEIANALVAASPEERSDILNHVLSMVTKHETDPALVKRAKNLIEGVLFGGVAEGAVYGVRAGLSQSQAIASTIVDLAKKINWEGMQKQGAEFLQDTSGSVPRVGHNQPPDTLDDQNEWGFYSELQRQISAEQQEKFNGDQLLKRIKKMPGVKADEVYWTGLDEFLKGKKSVSKEEVLDFLVANDLNLHQTLRGTGTPESEIVWSDAEIDLDPDFINSELERLWEQVDDDSSTSGWLLSDIVERMHKSDPERFPLTTEEKELVATTGKLLDDTARFPSEARGLQAGAFELLEPLPPWAKIVMKIQGEGDLTTIEPSFQRAINDAMYDVAEVSYKEGAPYYTAQGYIGGEMNFWLGGDTHYFEAWGNDDIGWSVQVDAERIEDTAASLEEAQIAAHRWAYDNDVVSPPGVGNTRWDSWTIGEPGDDFTNYQELSMELNRLPEAHRRGLTPPLDEAQRRRLDELNQIIENHDLESGQRSASQVFLERKNRGLGDALEEEEYKALKQQEAFSKHDLQVESGHWDEKQMLFHVRMNDRVGPLGEKVLFIEEIQSDWSKAGHADLGWHRPMTEKETARLEELKKKTSKPDELDEGINRILSNRMMSSERPNFKRIQPEIAKAFDLASLAEQREILKLLRQMKVSSDPAVGRTLTGKYDLRSKLSDRSNIDDPWQNSDIMQVDTISSGSTPPRARLMGYRPSRADAYGVPRAPFVEDVNTYMGLGVRRILRFAAENGYDRIAWTSGKHQADRYNLVRKIDEVSVKETTPGPDGTMRFRVDAWFDGEAVNLPDRSGFHESDLVTLIGRENTDEVLRQIENSREEGFGRIGSALIPIDLKVGGEFRKQQYDKIIPNLFQKYGRKFSKESRLEKIDLGSLEDVLSLKISDEMRGSIKSKGVPLYSAAPVIPGLAVGDQENQPTQ